MTHSLKNNSIGSFILFQLLLFVFNSPAFAEESLNLKLRQFANAPQQFMNRLPDKYSEASFFSRASTANRFSSSQIESREFVNLKQQEWEACHQSVALTSPFAYTKESWRSFFKDETEVQLVSDLKEMDRLNLQKADLAQHPWSGDYWAIARGILGARYLSKDFNALKDWLARFQFITTHPVQEILSSQGEEGIRDLSPSEKYDLLVGDDQMNFTASQWQQGKVYHDSNGKVENWMGICHGWAPASYMEERPKKAIVETSADNRWKIRFSPSDLKGLISYSWANNEYQTKFLGQRCHNKNPKKDENGRIIDQQCFDVNPATWHRVIVNHIGVLNKAFVMDVSFDYEVWNQPVFSYSYKYFNPQTKESTSDLESARVLKSDFNSDQFSKYRASNTKSVIGIAMKVGYTIEVGPNDRQVNLSREDKVQWVEYLYDLELDSRDNIVGGEWYQNAHPDFLWSPVRDSKPGSALDAEIQNSNWSEGPIPASWSRAALRSSPSGTILNTITKALLEKAQ